MHYPTHRYRTRELITHMEGHRDKMASISEDHPLVRTLDAAMQQLSDTDDEISNLAEAVRELHISLKRLEEYTETRSQTKTYFTPVTRYSQP